MVHRSTYVSPSAVASNEAKYGRLRLAVWIVLAALVAACGSSPPAEVPDGGLDAGGDAPSLQPGQDATVQGFDNQWIYYASGADHRTADTNATFPGTGEYSSIVLHLKLACPQGGCDVYDRLGTVGVVLKGAGDAGSDLVVEIARFITPFGVGGTWDIDVTDLRPLLKGNVALRASITTYSGPGSAYGAGWLLSTSFEMTGGIPAADPVAVVPLWPSSRVVYGDPSRPMPAQIGTATVALPAASSYGVRAFITGHGQGNVDNCSEFCSRQHTLTVGTQAHTTTIWRNDCAQNPIKNQNGTWQYPRAGWCPGSDVHAWTFDATADIAGASSVSVAYDAESYDNTCSPQAAADGGTCSGCTLGSSCAYDGGLHTEPFYMVSAVLIAYR